MRRAGLQKLDTGVETTTSAENVTEGTTTGLKPAGRKRSQGPKYSLRSATSIVKSLFGYYVLFLCFLVFFQRSIIFPGTSIRALDPTQTGGRVVRLAKESEDEPDAVALYFHPKTPAKATLVYFHGNADQLGAGPARIGQEFASNYGLGFFAVEYPGFGLSKGRPTEQTIVSTADRLLRHLISSEGLAVPQNQVILLGQSIGCAVALEMASRGFGERLILLSPFKSLHAMAEAAYPFVVPALRLWPRVLWDRFDNLAKARNVTLPSLVVHGRFDEVVPFSQGIEVSSALQNASMDLLEMAQHNDMWDPEHSLLQTVVDFLEHGH
eukprot:TRINITY_DN7824_c0_g1_i1.p1 TRINITY_DN7824_c0_g1~~TRINITY_DN7824_c0_g1_i1.p1  ORF type:complete len:324 (+),score=41.95 TRINITY_DN7824_c0_g1_i1:21-992(+)